MIGKRSAPLRANEVTTSIAIGLLRSQCTCKIDLWRIMITPPKIKIGFKTRPGVLAVVIQYELRIRILVLVLIIASIARSHLS